MTILKFGRRLGFTLVELLIAMGMAAFIFVTVSSFLVTLLSSNTKSRRQEAFEQVKNDLAAEFSNSIRWAGTITTTINDMTVDDTHYELVGGRIVRNSEAITPENVEVIEFTVADLSATASLASLRIEVLMRDANYGLTQDRLTLTVSQRQTKVGGSL